MIHSTMFATKVDFLGLFFVFVEADVVVTFCYLDENGP